MFTRDTGEFPSQGPSEFFVGGIEARRDILNLAQPKVVASVEHAEPEIVTGKPPQPAASLLEFMRQERNVTP